jgi:hypothetical protein
MKALLLFTSLNRGSVVLDASSNGLYSSSRMSCYLLFEPPTWVVRQQLFLELRRRSQTWYPPVGRELLRPASKNKKDKKVEAAFLSSLTEWTRLRQCGIPPRLEVGPEPLIWGYPEYHYLYYPLGI